MATYFIGDIHGCYKNLLSILDRIQFNPNTDIIYLTGDLVSRGPRSLEVLRWARSLSNKVKTVLGNHDLYLLKTFFEKKKNQKSRHCFKSVLNAPDSNVLIDWLRHQPLLYVNEDKKFIISHAGIHPKWNIWQSKSYAKTIEKILISDNPQLLFNKLNQENHANMMHITTNQLKQIQENLNVFTKMRYVYLNGRLNFTYKDNPKNAPDNIYPWFNLSKFITPDYSIIFGHWATLQNTHVPKGFYGLDSGCCWGEKLTALRWEDKTTIKISCSPPA